MHLYVQKMQMEGKTVDILIRLLLEEQSDLGLDCWSDLSAPILRFLRSKGTLKV